MLRVLICLCVCVVVLNAKLDKKFIKQVVKSHNKYRKLHSVKPVVESRKMSKRAQKWAEHVEKVGYFEKKPNNKYGENYSYRFGEAKGSDHIDDLYFFHESYYKAVGYYEKEAVVGGLSLYDRFTQIVWKATKKIGVGRSGEYAVIFYWPKGNIENKFLKNVLPPKTEA